MKIDKALIHSYPFTIRPLSEADGGGSIQGLKVGRVVRIFRFAHFPKQRLRTHRPGRIQLEWRLDPASRAAHLAGGGASMCGT